MRILKWMGLLVLVLAVMVLVGGSFISPRYVVTRGESILASPRQVYALLADPRAWMEWTVWKRRDPQMRIEFSGATTGTGAMWAWKSKAHGSGSMTFTDAQPGQRIAFELRQADLGTLSRGELTLRSDGAWTHVTWTVQGDVGDNLLLRWMALLIEPLLGRDFREGLANLKTLAERA